MSADLRVGVLASGRGTNLQALLDAASEGELGGSVVLVGCNRVGARAIERARKAGVPVCVADRAELPRRADRQAKLRLALEAERVELVVLAGYDEILTPPFVSAFEGRMINIHPSLLPAFGGTMHAVREALQYGVKVTGCTVHLVTEEPDGGPILLQRCVEVRPDDSEERLQERVLAEEHRALVEAVRAFADGRVDLQGRRAVIREAMGSATGAR